MNEWHINNQSTQPFLIQQNEALLSIVKPLPNGSFKILSEINLSNGQINNNDESLVISVDIKSLELNIFDR
ncbi:hypothetical protein CD116_05960 [Staphylococcus schweitzeri]|uniref:Uncharacterized protein n=1 Tax=Staphylococcus schweitzeri TaxID=1654388 RepID=A0A2K4AIF4_9STAP|nr:hypothetical protein [Staphylococcus schweitzeri]MBE2129973.1 hypothetical protein [Staphylococcus schweitzeri]PNZ49852.1 hypothetical protein CD116_05960 [Staphylococcus schweitzeri]CDR29394.1 hypothetical protein ERS140147_02606 [Staphylococcus schweitzeri]CDR55215.1 hypothetical protein ERS140266_02619 [Staphylococcus schweitzeri]CDR62429.1 hypothetical protein ERS140239_02300 [Staphylococcus schweitzeri]